MRKFQVTIIQNILISDALLTLLQNYFNKIDMQSNNIYLVFKITSVMRVHFSKTNNLRLSRKDDDSL